MAEQAKIVEIRLRNGRTESGSLASPFRPMEKQITIRKQNEVYVFPLEEIICIFFIGEGGTTTRLPGEVVDDVQTIDGESIRARVLQNQALEEGFYGIPMDYDERVQRVFFTQQGVRFRQEQRQIGQILQDEGIVLEQKVQEALDEQQKLRSRKIGEIVHEKHGVPEAEVEKAEQEHKTAPAKKKMQLGDILVSSNLITEEQLSEALAEQRKSKGKHLGDLLIEKEIITEEQLVMCLAMKFRLKFVDLQDISPKPEALEAVSRELAIRLHVFPIDADDRHVVVATSEPTNAGIADALRFHTGLWVELVVATSSQIKEALSKYFGHEEKLSQLAIEVSESRDDEEDNEDTNVLEHEAEQAPIVRLANKILIDGIHASASDIHVFPAEKSLKVAFRTHGLLKQHLEVEKKVHISLITRFKIISGMDISEHRMPQDGRIKITMEGRQVEFRVSCMPGLHGENMVFRILNIGAEQRLLDELGFEHDDVASIRRISHGHHGMMLVTGPTGSGKSTTMLSVLRDLTTQPKHLISLEDPVEAQVAGVNQIQINEKIGFSFANALRNILRHDPDVIMVGEIRDAETAKIAVQASLTGHVLISSLHTNTAVGAFMRLEDMGVEAYMVASTLKGIAAQQLLPRLCEHCCEEREADQDTVEFIKQHGFGMENPKDYFSPGCKECDNTGVGGRIMVYEFLEVSRKISSLVSKEASEDEILAAAHEAGMVTMGERAMKYVEQKQVSLEQIVSLLSE